MERSTYTRSLLAIAGRGLGRKRFVSLEYSAIRAKRPEITATHALSWARARWERMVLDLHFTCKDVRDRSIYSASILGYDVTMEARYDKYTDISWLGSFTESPTTDDPRERIRFDKDYVQLPGNLSWRDFRRSVVYFESPSNLGALKDWKGKHRVEEYRTALYRNMQTLLSYYDGSIVEYGCVLTISKYGEVLAEDSLCGVTEPLDYLAENLFHVLSTADKKETHRAA